MRWFILVWDEHLCLVPSLLSKNYCKNYEPIKIIFKTNKMKNRIITTIALIACSNAVSMAQHIAAARAAAVGSNVTIRGIVLNGSELGSIRYVQDITGGISIYGSNLSTVNRGDSIIANGTLTSYNNLLEITPVTFTVFATGNALPTPATLTPTGMTEAYEGQLVKVNNGLFTLGGGTFAGNTNYNYVSSAQTAQVRVATTSTLVGTVIPNASVNLIGILSQFCSSPVTGCTTGYQLLLRDWNDIINNSSIYITAQPAISNISTSGFDLAWGTNIAGSNSYIKIAKDQLLTSGVVTLTANSAISHTTSVTGLPAASVYYAKVFSINGTDTASSSTKAYCTKSNSSGTVKAYFTRSVDNTVASTGNNAKPLIGLIDDTLIAYINRAKSELEIAIYNWDNSSGITTAVNAAAARGVKVRIVYDGSTAQSGLTTISTQCKWIASPQGANYTIMHNKFVVIDVNSPSDAIVWTGSTNWTNAQLNTDANNVIIFQDQSMARGYKIEFDEMWGDTVVTSSANIALSKFGQFKTDNTPHEYIVGGKRVEQYFSPSDNTNSALLATLNTANSTMNFCSMLVSRTDLATKIETQFQSMSLTGQGLVDDSTGYGTQFNYMKTGMGAANIAVDGHSWILHHKYVVIDQANTSSDPLVFTGSHNWSNAADQKNDENTVVVHDAAIANQYFQEFTMRWNERTLLAAGVDETQHPLNGLTIYPNPTTGSFTLNYTLGDVGSVFISVYDYMGKKVETKTTEGVTGSNVITLSANEYAKGIYLVEIMTGNKKETKKLIVQ